MNTTPKQKDLVTFGLIWSGIFLIIATYPLLTASGDVTASSLLDHLRMWAVGIAAAFAIVVLSRPTALSGIYKLWIKFGEFIGGIMSKIIMAVLFFFLFTPISLFFKLIRRDALHRSVDRSANSYWVKRDEQPGSLKNQF